MAVIIFYIFNKFVCLNLKPANMELIDIVKSRTSVRTFQNKKIDRQTLIEVLESARLAPSACNNQPWKFIIVDEPAILKQLSQAYTREWFANAPQVIVICGNYQESWKRPLDGKDHCEVDVAIATDHITLMATAKGLGTCWVCNFNPDKVSEALQLPQQLKPLVLLPIGYPKEPITLVDKKRKNLNEIVFYNNLGNLF
jgi:nitroreductase